MLDAKYINSFILGTEDIFNQVAGNIELERQKPYLKQAHLPTDAIVCIMGLTGDINGRVVFAFNSDFALELINNMCGMEISEIDEMVLSAMGEFSNMVSGNATIKLDNIAQKKVNITPPEIKYIQKNNKDSFEAPMMCIRYHNKNRFGFEINFAS